MGTILEGLESHTEGLERLRLGATEARERNVQDLARFKDGNTIDVATAGIHP